MIDGDAKSGGVETIAAGTGGKVFQVGNRSPLDGVFREIDHMQKARFKQVPADWVDDYTATFSQLSRRLNGSFFDCNVRHIPSDALAKLNAEALGAAKGKPDYRMLALIPLAAATILLCLLPLLLEYLGSAWRPRGFTVKPLTLVLIS